ncbi:hypothetical protein D3P08_25555 [Paenibacillus nanensis]|uniref:DUF4097 domain-containing protein n=1 Tax=Paenibacillus nanensis TaxID=393251 RepID=A0A3A1UKS5_9BACL|nr:DUF6677 family protein [Paenibacillus nanensis]RIX47279.1 hypothetical protein D3P08_25555 [Paenibacillus nanensis]
MGKLGIKRRGGRLASVLLAFLLPGMGHVWNGQYAKGFLLFAGLLLDYTAIFRLADSDGGRHLLLIVYLMLLLPLFYFISVYEVLQMDEPQYTEPSGLRLKGGILLASAGLLMMILVKPPHFMLPWMNELAEWSVGPLLMLVSIALVLFARKGAARMFKLGRMTAAVVIFAIGALLIWDLAKGRNDIAVLSEWWPVVFILLGMEMILYATVLKGKAGKLRLDMPGFTAALVITVTAYAITQYADFPVRWLDQFNVDLNGRHDYGEEKGYRFDKNVIKVPFDENVTSIKVINANGDLTVRSGDVEEVELQATVWIDLASEAEAAEIAEQSIIEINPGNEIVIEGKGQAFGPNGNRLPRMNMIITLPEVEAPPEAADTMPPDSVAATPEPGATSAAGQAVSSGNALEEEQESGVEGLESNSSLDPSPLLEELPKEELAVPPEPVQTIKLEIESDNGSVTVSSLSAADGVTVRNGSGLVKLSSILGPVSVEGVNSSIEADSVAGKTSLVTKNGTILANSISDGAIYASTLNGDIELSNIAGDLDVETKNGGILVSGASSDVKADTLNGSIEIASPVVGGNWDLDSSVGEIKLQVPYNGNFSVYGSVTFGNITTDLPLEQTRKTIRGTIGENVYRIHINATNSISIHGQGI